MKNTFGKPNLANRRIPAIVAVGSSLVALPAGALELGELTVQSRLGQPLRASIAYALAPNEQISGYCVTMRPGPSVSGLPGFGRATVSVSNGVILLTGDSPVREPMVSAHVVVNCPYSANLSREYLLFIDPLSPAYDTPTVTQETSSAVAITAVPEAAVGRPVSRIRPEPVAKDIVASTEYRVRAGESLSEIAQRIENRPVGLWTAVNDIFAANPHAFIGNDPNRLKAGSVLSIPNFGESAVTVSTIVSTRVATPESPAEAGLTEPEVNAPAGDGAAAAETTATAAALDAYDPDGANVLDLTPTPVDLDALAASDAGANDAPSGTVIIDADLEGPTTTSTSPNVPSAIIKPAATANNGTASPSWLVGLAGGGIAVILGLLLFGRRFRGEATLPPATPEQEQNYGRRASDMETTDTSSVAALDVDYDLSDDSPTEENLALDADLVMGTGLEQGAGSDDAHDFSFATTSEVEVDDDYDMSVIVDATKMPEIEDITERDLQAIEITPDDDSVIAQQYTISQEVDYKVLEQDYEDEHTATQALNNEIARAAADLADIADDAVADDQNNDDDLTAALPLATVTELDVTAQMPTQNDAVSDADATSTEEVITVNTAAEEDTVEMPRESGKAG